MERTLKARQSLWGEHLEGTGTIGGKTRVSSKIRTHSGRGIPFAVGAATASYGTLARPQGLGRKVRSTTDLLDLELVFSQQRLLTLSQFEAECERRGLRFFSGQDQLEALHRAGALVPLYRAAKDVRAVFAQSRRPAGQGIPPELALLHACTSARELRADRAAHRLHDPRTEPYRPWSRYQRTFGAAHRWTSEFLYSPYQLLLLPVLAPVMQQMRRRRLGPGRYRFRLPAAESPLLQIRKRALHNDDLVVALTALEPAYRPLVVQQIVFPSDVDDRTAARWEHYHDAFDRVATLSWLGWDAEHVKAAAEGLSAQAWFIDPLRDWEELVRLIRPAKWGRLLGDALVALDQRIAAEMLWLFYEDLVKADAAPPFEPVARERLRPNPAELDTVLMDFGLSPHPALVLEGATEMLLVPRVMDLLDVPRWPSFIQLVEAGGSARPLDLLAAYVATPQLGELLEGGVLLMRPPTRFLVAFDPEHSYATADQRRRVRELWVDKLLACLSHEHRTPKIHEQLADLVMVETWGTAPFEFAHFSDDEISRAILQAYQGNDAPSPERLAAQVGIQRRHNANIEKLWQRWIGLKPSKVVVAEALWPVLEAKIRAAQAAGSLQRILVARVVVRASDLAAEFRRSDLLLRR